MAVKFYLLCCGEMALAARNERAFRMKDRDARLIRIVIYIIIAVGGFFGMVRYSMRDIPNDPATIHPPTTEEQPEMSPEEKAEVSKAVAVYQQKGGPLFPLEEDYGKWTITFSGDSNTPEESERPKPVFEGNVSDLKSTVVVATLEAPLPKGSNTVWCSSFVACWKSLADELTQGPPKLVGAPAMATRLNAATDARKEIPPENLYTAAGWVNKGIGAEIRKGLKEKFPQKTPPRFDGLSPDSVVAYAYLEAKIKFAIPYEKAKTPLVFTPSQGKGSDVDSFGIAHGSDSLFLRDQPAVLYMEPDEKSLQPKECAIDLDRGSELQVVVALTPPGTTLAETVATVEKKIALAASKDKTKRPGLKDADALRVPVTAWRVMRRFTELEGRGIENAPAMPEAEIQLAQQDIFFRLDRSGAEVYSESFTVVASANGHGPTPRPVYYIFDKPFLVYMKARGAKQPFFVMWVDNPELLNKWTAKK
ncbi:MAG: hypothetical protein HN370_06395 [Phycisphaerales bacterium]|nr:hypothetical protein [Phycisphaerales bacterium]